jgi:hypothetical protein
MTEDDVRLAVESYARDDYQLRKCEGRYKCFSDFFRDCPDIVDKQLARIGVARGQDRQKDRAASVLRWNAWGTAASMATVNRHPLHEYINLQCGVARPRNDDLSRAAHERRALDAWFRKLLATIQAYQSLTKNEAGNLMARASRCFKCYAGRVQSMKNLDDVNLRMAMAYSLLGRYGKSKVTVQSTPEMARDCGG